MWRSIISASSASLNLASNTCSGAGNWLSPSSWFAPSAVSACMFGTRRSRATVTTPSISRAGGSSAFDAPSTSFSAPIVGSHGSSAAGAVICGRGSVRDASRRVRSSSRRLAVRLSSASLTARSMLRFVTLQRVARSSRIFSRWV